LAIFSWKKSDNDGKKPPTDVTTSASPDGEFSPEKAERFFQHARSMFEASNYEYSAQLWLSGLKLDPNNVASLEGFFGAIARFLDESGGKKGVSKDVAKHFGGKGDVDRFLMSLLEWGQKPADSTSAVRASEAASKLGLKQATLWITDRAFGLCVKDKKPRKDYILKCAEAYSKADSFEKALVASEQALKVDPTDGELAGKIRSLAAQATMNKGGFDTAGQAGGFRANIRDADKQRQLEEGERIVKTEETVDRLIIAAAEELGRRPGDLPTIERYAKLLLERARPADEERAYQLYMQTHEQSTQFRFRELAGDLRIRQSRRKVSELKIMLEKSPDSDMLQRMFSQADEEHNQLELSEFKLRVAAYPSDLSRRFELGRRLFAVGQFQDAIEQFQESQHDPRNRAASMLLLGQSFQKISWNDEAIETFRHASDLKDLLPDSVMELRYFLMIALQAKAETDSDVACAEEADRLASMIARQQMSYKDIRNRREAIKTLLIKLRSPRGGTDTAAQPA
jgi:tetratricopeptide (TPR) repeat protein